MNKAYFLQDLEDVKEELVDLIEEIANKDFSMLKSDLIGSVSLVIKPNKTVSLIPHMRGTTVEEVRSINKDYDIQKTTYEEFKKELFKLTLEGYFHA